MAKDGHVYMCLPHQMVIWGYSSSFSRNVLLIAGEVVPCCLCHQQCLATTRLWYLGHGGWVFSFNAAVGMPQHECNVEGLCPCLLCIHLRTTGAEWKYFLTCTACRRRHAEIWEMLSWAECLFSSPWRAAGPYLASGCTVMSPLWQRFACCFAVWRFCSFSCKRKGRVKNALLPSPGQGICDNQQWRVKRARK